MGKKCNTNLADLKQSLIVNKYMLVPNIVFIPGYINIRLYQDNNNKLGDNIGSVLIDVCVKLLEFSFLYTGV